jgi:hypothetical protein
MSDCPGIAIDGVKMTEEKLNEETKKTSGVKVMGIISFAGCWLTILISVIAVFINSVKTATPIDVANLFQFSSLGFGIFATVWGAKAVYNFSPKAKSKE